MKINWGTGIAISLGLFAVLILSFVIRIVTMDKYDHDLVTENYYEKEVLLQREIDGIMNAKTLRDNIEGRKTEEGYLLLFPSDFKPQQIKGKISWYRPSNKKLDFEIPLSLTENRVLIPWDKLASGRWNVSIFWEYDGAEYYFEKKLIF